MGPVFTPDEKTPSSKSFSKCMEVLRYSSRCSHLYALLFNYLVKHPFFLIY